MAKSTQDDKTEEIRGQQSKRTRIKRRIQKPPQRNNVHESKEKESQIQRKRKRSQTQEELADRKKKKKIMPTSVSSFASIIKLITRDARLSEEQKSFLETYFPFYELIEAIDQKKVTMESTKKYETPLKDFKMMFQKGRNMVKVGDMEISLTPEDFLAAFGILGGQEAIQIYEMTHGRPDEAAEFVDILGGAERITHAVLKTKLIELINGKQLEDNIKICQLLTLFVLAVLFVPTTGNSLSWGYTKYVKHVAKIKTFNWAGHIHSKFIASMDKNDIPEHTGGCIMILPYWMLEKFHVTEAHFPGEKLWCARWHLGKFWDQYGLCQNKVKWKKTVSQIFEESQEINLGDDSNPRPSQDDIAINPMVNNTHVPESNEDFSFKIDKILQPGNEINMLKLNEAAAVKTRHEMQFKLDEKEGKVKEMEKEIAALNKKSEEATNLNTKLALDVEIMKKTISEQNAMLETQAKKIMEKETQCQNQAAEVSMKSQMLRDAESQIQQLKEQLKKTQADKQCGEDLPLFMVDKANTVEATMEARVNRSSKAKEGNPTDQTTSMTNDDTIGVFPRANVRQDNMPFLVPEDVKPPLDVFPEIFKVIVDGEDITLKLPKFTRDSYIRLCCSQNSSLHRRVPEGMSASVVIPIICQIIEISDAMKRCTVFTPRTEIEKWRNLLMLYSGILDIGFLRNIADKLLELEASKALEMERVENAKNQTKILEEKIQEMWIQIDKFFEEIQNINENKNKTEAFENMFKEVTASLP